MAAIRSLPEHPACMQHVIGAQKAGVAGLHCPAAPVAVVDYSTVFQFAMFQ